MDTTGKKYTNLVFISRLHTNRKNHSKNEEIINAQKFIDQAYSLTETGRIH